MGNRGLILLGLPGSIQNVPKIVLEDRDIYPLLGFLVLPKSGGMPPGDDFLDLQVAVRGAGALDAPREKANQQCCMHQGQVIVSSRDTGSCSHGGGPQGYDAAPERDVRLADHS